MRCSYCYNKSIACDNDDLPKMDVAEVFSFLEKRKSLIDAVVISGGEPTIQEDLLDFLSSLKLTKLKIKLDSNGLKPSVIKKVIASKLVDYIAIDIKTSPAKYESLTNVSINIKKIIKTINILKSSDVDYELRTTAIPEFFTEKDIEDISKITGHVKKYYIQQFIPENTMDENFEMKTPYTQKEIIKLKKIISKFSDICDVRGI